MPSIHPLSVVDPSARIADDVFIGPFCIVEAGVEIGSGTRLDSNVTIRSGTSIGERNVFAAGAIIGGDPQDRKYHDEETFLKIGDDNVFREYVTIHRATGAGKYTVVGNRCYLMAFVHVGHNCTLWDDITISNGVGLSGHCTIENLVTIGGMTGLHQFVRVGKAAMVGGISRITRDVPPYCIVVGDDRVLDLNAVGLRRAGVKQEARLAIHKAIKLLFKSQLGMSHAIEVIRREVKPAPEVEELITFMERLYRGKNGRGDQP